MMGLRVERLLDSINIEEGEDEGVCFYQVPAGLCVCAIDHIVIESIIRVNYLYFTGFNTIQSTIQ